MIISVSIMEIILNLSTSLPTKLYCHPFGSVRTDHKGFQVHVLSQCYRRPRTLDVALQLSNNVVSYSDVLLSSLLHSKQLYNFDRLLLCSCASHVTDQTL